MKCEYCTNTGIPRLDDGTGAVCRVCWSLLQRPETALPLLRGHLVGIHRGKMPEARLQEIIQNFMAKMSTFKRPG